MKRSLFLLFLFAVSCAAMPTPTSRERLIITGQNLALVSETRREIVLTGENIQILLVTP